jgi:hypothetical protein
VDGQREIRNEQRRRVAEAMLSIAEDDSEATDDRIAAASFFFSEPPEPIDSEKAVAELAKEVAKELAGELVKLRGRT